MEMVDFKQMVYLPDENRYCPVDEVPAGRQDGRHLRHAMSATSTWPRGLQLPEWFSRPAVAEILERGQPAQVPPGLTHLVHRAFGLGQEHHRARH